jgi:hypothetical protein
MVDGSASPPSSPLIALKNQSLFPGHLSSVPPSTRVKCPLRRHGHPDGKPPMAGFPVFQSRIMFIFKDFFLPHAVSTRVTWCPGPAGPEPVMEPGHPNYIMSMLKLNLSFRAVSTRVTWRSRLGKADAEVRLLYPAAILANVQGLFHSAPPRVCRGIQ